MRITKLYNDFLLLVEKNATNNNLNADVSRFISLFNFTTTRYQSYLLDKRNEDAIRELSPFLKRETLAKVDTQATYNAYSLPKDYFNFSNLDVRATKGKCKGKKLTVWEVKSENLEELLEDPNNNPDFYARETFYHLSEKGVDIYKKDFEIEKAEMLYYRKIKPADIAGYIKIEDGEPSTDVDTELLDESLPRVLTATAKLFMANQGDANGYQIQNAQLFSY